MTTNYWTRRMSRRRALATGGAASAGIAGFALVGCGDDDDNGTGNGNGTTPGTTPTQPSETPAAGDPRHGGELTIEDVGRFSGLFDPHTALGDNNGFWNIISNLIVYAHPQTVEPIQPGLVEDWEQVDETTLTLNVRPNVHFHEGYRTDGRQLVADDIAFNILRIAGMLERDAERTALFGRRTSLAGLANAEAVDDETVSVTFSSPNAIFLNGLADWRNGLVPPELVDEDPNFNDMRMFSGTGPFMVESWSDSDTVGTFVRNPNYWEPDKPYLERVREVQLPDAAGALSAFLGGQLDMTFASSPDLRSTISGSRPDARIIDWEYIGWRNFRFNPSRVEAFADPRVRRAIHLALNYADIMDNQLGEGFWDYTGPIPSGFPGAWTSDEIAAMPGWNPDTKEQDIADARALMGETGFPDGDFSFAILSLGAGADADAYTVHIMDQLRQVWPDMDVTADLATGADFNRRHPGGDFDAVSWSYNPAPAALLETNLHYTTGGGRNYGDFSDPDIDELVDRGIQEFDSDQRVALIGELQELLAEQMPIVPIGKPRTVIAVQDHVKGLEGLGGPGTFTVYDVAAFTKEYWLEED